MREHHPTVNPTLTEEDWELLRSRVSAVQVPESYIRLYIKNGRGKLQLAGI